MPSKSRSEHNYMQAIAHGWHPTHLKKGKKPPSREVAQHFVDADKKAGKYQGRKRKHK